MSTITITTEQYEDLLGRLSSLEEMVSKLSLPKRAKKSAKSDRLEDVTEASDIDDLKRATVDTLKNFLKDSGLRTSGTKNELMERTWRMVKGEVSDGDRSPKSKPKAVKPKKEVHACSCTNKKGALCAINADRQVEIDGQVTWFCWKHDPSNEPTTPSSSDNEAPTPAPKPKKRVVKKKPAQLEEEE